MASAPDATVIDQSPHIEIEDNTEAAEEVFANAATFKVMWAFRSRCAHLEETWNRRNQGGIKLGRGPGIRLRPEAFPVWRERLVRVAAAVGLQEYRT